MAPHTSSNHYPALIAERLAANTSPELYLQTDLFSSKVAPSAVLFLLGPGCDYDHRSPALCLLLNKRSQSVKQPGDLCCPGGSITPHVDTLLAHLLRLPLSPLTRWPAWASWHHCHPRAARQLTLLLATGLRESFEEMRLNPLGVDLVGLLPPQRLVMFNRVIYPLVAWVPRQKRFYPNWEVDKIVRIPIAALLNTANYACLQLKFAPGLKARRHHEVREFPCFIFGGSGSKELLWGATYRITVGFLELVFGFNPPPLSALPVVQERLEASYLQGAYSR